MIGTPAEEGGGGKVRLISGGVFEDVDAAMMIHGWDRWILHQDLLGIVRVAFEFTGKAAHASADPWEGVNALDAVIQTFNNVSMLRQQVRPTARIHGIVTSGGAAPNIIPEFAACTLLRPRRRARRTCGQLHDARHRVRRGRREGDRLPRCKVDRATRHPYEPLKRNDTLLDAFRANMRAVGVAGVAGAEGPARARRTSAT